MMESLERKNEPILVTIVTGFLGSGKTTFLNQILQEPRLKDTLVIVNEFGEIGIDHILLENVEDDGVLELSSGCLCCTIRGKLVDALEEIVVKIKNGKISRIRRIIIETTGLADPIPILQTFLVHPVLKSHFQLNGVITCVDLVMGIRTQIDHVEAERQIAVADRIILTKSDLIEKNSTASQEISALITKLKFLNPDALMLDFASREITFENLFNCSESNSVNESESLAASKQVNFSQNVEKLKENNSQSSASNHDKKIHSFSLTNERMMSLKALENFLEVLAAVHGPKLLRTKGIVGIQDHPDFPIAVNGVRHVFHPFQKLEKWPDNNRLTKLVFISEKIADSELRKLFFAFAGIPDIDTPDMDAVKDNPLAIAGFSRKLRITCESQSNMNQIESSDYCLIGSIC